MKLTEPEIKHLLILLRSDIEVLQELYKDDPDNWKEDVDLELRLINKLEKGL